jgi:hypothetical protein
MRNLLHPQARRRLKILRTHDQRAGQALTAAVKQAVDIDLSNMATKTDIADVRREVAEMKAELVKWVVGIGLCEFMVEAKSLRGVIKEMDRLYPGLGEHLEEETTVAIDGAVRTRFPVFPVLIGIFSIYSLRAGLTLQKSPR